MPKKKPKKSTVAKKRRWKAQLLAILREISDKFSDKLRTSHAGVIEQSESGVVTILIEGLQVRHDLCKKAPPQACGCYYALGYAQMLIHERDSKSFFPDALSFLTGLSSGMIMVQDEMQDLQSKITRLTEHRAKGGRASRRLSAEQEVIAKEYVEAELKPRVSFTAACNRAAAKLYKEQSINVSGKTLMRLFPPECRDSA